MTNRHIHCWWWWGARLTGLYWKLTPTHSIIWIFKKTSEKDSLKALVPNFICNSFLVISFIFFFKKCILLFQLKEINSLYWHQYMKNILVTSIVCSTIVYKCDKFENLSCYFYIVIDLLICIKFNNNPGKQRLTHFL